MNTNTLYISGAIVVAGLLIAGSVIYSGGMVDSTHTAHVGNDFGNNLSPTADNIRPVNIEEDHIWGSPDAKVSIVEFSDFECPFCRRIHSTLKQIVEESEGEVRWVYRHFPLSTIHSNALTASIASECAAELGGNESFWSFGDELFNNQKDLGDNELYASLARDVGLPEGEFMLCLQTRRHQDRIRADNQDAIASGGRGTPFVVVLNENGDTFTFSGALPYAQVKSIVELALE